MLAKIFEVKVFISMSFIAIFSCVNVYAQQCKGLPVTKVGLITAIHKKYPRREILEIIGRCGVNFQSNSQTDQELVAAGASQTILAAIRDNYHSQTIDKNADPDFKKGYDFYEAGKMQEAINAFQASINTKPSFKAYYNIGVSYSQLDQPDEAAKAYENAVRLDDTSAEGWAALGETYFNISENGGADKSDEAIQAFQKSLSLNPNQKAVLVMLAELNRASGKYNDAVKELVEALKIDSTYGDAWRSVCAVEYEANSSGDSAQDFTRAFQAGKKAVQFSPDDSEAWSCLGSSALQSKNYAEAVTALKKAIQLDPDDETAKDDLKEAQEALKKLK